MIPERIQRLPFPDEDGVPPEEYTRPCRPLRLANGLFELVGIRDGAPMVRLRGSDHVVAAAWVQVMPFVLGRELRKRLERFAALRRGRP